MAVQAGLCLAWSETSADTFCRVLAQIKVFHHLLIKRKKNRVKAFYYLLVTFGILGDVFCDKLIYFLLFLIMSGTP